MAILIPALWTSMEYGLPLPEALRALHGCGWRAFEVSSEHLEEIEKSDRPGGLIDGTLQCMRELDLLMPQAHGLLGANLAEADGEKRQAYLDRLMRHMDICADLGVRVIVIHPATIPTTTRADLQRMGSVRWGIMRAQRGFGSALRTWRRAARERRMNSTISSRRLIIPPSALRSIPPTPIC